MSDIIISPEYEALQKEIKELNDNLVALIEEKDQLLYHTCPMLESEYIIQLGILEYKAFEFQCKLLRIKRKIELVQQKFNRQEIVIITDIEAQLDKEYAQFEEKLNEKMDEINKALDFSKGSLLSDNDAKELKRIYRKIVKRLHPDLHPDITETERKLFINAVEAYKNGDLKTLQSLEILIDEISSDTDFVSLDILKNKKEALQMHIKAILNSIDKIKAAFPYNQKEFLSDEKAVEEKKTALKGLIEQYKEQYKHYEERLSALLGG